MDLCTPSSRVFYVTLCKKISLHLLRIPFLWCVHPPPLSFFYAPSRRQPCRTCQEGEPQRPKAVENCSDAASCPDGAECPRRGDGRSVLPAVPGRVCSAASFWQFICCCCLKITKVKLWNLHLDAITHSRPGHYRTP